MLGSLPSGTRLALAVLVGCLAVAAVSAVAAGTAWTRDSTIEIYVEEREGDVVIVTIPGGCLELGAQLIPVAVPAREREQLRPYAPLLRATANALEAVPAGTLLRVKDRSQRVVIRRGEDGLWLLEVEAPGQRVRIAVPAVSAARMLRTLARAVS